MTAPLLISSGRVQYDDPSPVDNSVAPLSINEDGRLRVATKQGQFVVTAGTLDALNTTVALDVSEASNVVCHVKNTGTATMAAGSFSFEGSVDSTNGTDGTWFGIQAVRSNANIIETSTGILALAAGLGAVYSWKISVNAIRWFRVRTNAPVTTDSLATWSILPGGYATEPVPAAQTQAVTVSGTPAVTSSGTATVTPAQATPHSYVSTASTNANNFKSAPGHLFEISAFNPTAALAYVKLYNKATAPTVGTDVPIVTFPVAINSEKVLQFGAIGKRFSLGISMAITAGPLATDTAVTAAGIQVSASSL